MNEENGKVGDIELSGFENVFKFFSSSNRIVETQRWMADSLKL